MKRTVTLLLALVLLAAACGNNEAGTDPTDSTTPTTTPSPTTTLAPDPDRLVLRITDEGGFAPIEFLVNRLPRFSLYADGTLLYEGPTIAIFPGPMLPSIQAAKLTTGQMDDVMTLIEAIGLPTFGFESDNTNTNFVADATSTVATYVDPTGDEHVFRVYALGLVEGGSDMALNLGSLVRLLDGYTAEGTAGADFVAERIQVFLGEGQFVDPELTETRPWPLEVTPADFDDAELMLGCTVIEGAAAVTALDAFSTASQGTLWDFEGTERVLLARPLLPGETGCASR